jgi:hypothetical protein
MTAQSDLGPSLPPRCEIYQVALEVSRAAAAALDRSRDIRSFEPRAALRALERARAEITALLGEFGED